MKMNFDSPDLYIIIGVLLIAIGTLIIQAGNQAKSKKKNQELQQKLKNSESKVNNLLSITTTQNIELANLKEINCDQTEKLNTQGISLNKLSGDNSDLSKQLAKTSFELTKSITGGESYPIINYMSDPLVNNPSKVNVSIFVKGKYPLYDVTFTNLDLTGAKEQMEMLNQKGKVINTTRDEITKKLRAMSLPPLKAGSYNPIGREEFIGTFYTKNKYDVEYKLNTYSNARNGRFWQGTTLRKNKYGRWEVARYKITREVETVNGLVSELIEEKDF